LAYVRSLDQERGSPAGFYLGGNTRAWHKEDWDAWLAARPKADPPPEIVKPAPSVDAEGSGPIKASAGNQSKFRHSESTSICQASLADEEAA
jgi:hypothetical protein